MLGAAAAAAATGKLGQAAELIRERQGIVERLIAQAEDSEFEVEPVAEVTLYQGFVAMELYLVARPWIRSGR